jgi:hypothetical protein
MWLKWIVVMFVGLVFASGLLGQNQQPNGSHDTVVVAKDRMPVVDLNEIEILSNKRYHSYWKHRRITRLIYNVKKVYPFAKTAGALLRIYDVRLKNAKSDIERKKIMKKAEEDIKRRYTKPLEQLTFTQGFILIKLIDRETGNTSYGLLQKLRGKFTAFFYQAFARLWGYNLKARYDPKGKDKEIETIVKLIDQGKL